MQAETLAHVVSVEVQRGQDALKSEPLREMELHLGSPPCSDDKGFQPEVQEQVELQVARRDAPARTTLVLRLH